MLQLVFVCVIIVVLAMVALQPMGPGLKHATANGLMQQSRQIGQILFSYATDNAANGNAYPDGTSSTEVFQQMLDADYATDPNLFFVPMPGKVPLGPGQKKLKPENVSWDLTAPVRSDSSDLVPLVFLTGYKVSYTSGGSAVSLLHPPLEYGRIKPPTWWDDLLGRPFSYALEPSRGIPIFYKGNNATFINYSVGADGTIPDFVSPDFKPDGHTYRQLTPDGVLR